VGGIKTNISLFRRILNDPDFRGAKIDTGFLDRLLKRKEDTSADEEAAEVAAIAAGLFAALDARIANGSKGATDTSSNWKAAARREAMR
jgi:acetyl-CoA carboxylase biotin carboxylase subunit